MQYRSSWMTEELDVFREQFRKFLAKDLAPHAEKWRAQKMVDRSAWRALGEMGALLPSVPEAYGGLGASFAYDAAVIEDIETVVPEVTTGVSVHSAIVAHYILNYGSEEQKLRWLPKMASGEFVGAIAMTEPGTGSDLQGVRTTARKQGNNYVINGQKTFITNGQAADLIIVVARTGGPGAKGLSLIVLETEGNEGFRRGRNLDKIGLHASDTSELFFDNAVAPPENLLGAEEGNGFVQLMQQLPQERLSLAVGAVASMERAVKLTADYTKERTGVRQAHHRIPEHRVQAGRTQDRGHDRARLRRLVHRTPRRRRTRYRHRLDGEMVVFAEAGRDRGRMPAAPWRLRLHAGISDLADVRGRADPEDLRRHQRDHEAADRAIAVAPASARSQRLQSRLRDDAAGLWRRQEAQQGNRGIRLLRIFRQRAFEKRRRLNVSRDRTDEIGARHIDQFGDLAGCKAIDAADHFELVLLDGCVEDRRGRFQLGDVIDHVLADGVVERISALLCRRLHRGRNRSHQRRNVSRQAACCPSGI